nr:MAG TPA: hypothetical protein [Caudoviricetes sp.]
MCAMRSALVVELTPSFNQHLSLCPAAEPLPVTGRRDAGQRWRAHRLLSGRAAAGGSPRIARLCGR